jgi:hypothetical protein
MNGDLPEKKFRRNRVYTTKAEGLPHEEIAEGFSDYWLKRMVKNN